MSVFVHQTPSEVAEAVAAEVGKSVDGAAAPFSLGLAGGTTPERTYRAMRSLDVPWDRVTAWLSDERWVPPDHARSNGSMAEDVLFGGVEATLVRPEWSEGLSPTESAQRYEETLRGLHAEGTPDLVLLGMGDDGHTASLFPGSKALDERERWFVANRIPESGEWRLTATYPLLWSAKRLIVIVTGESKARALAAAQDGHGPVARLADGGVEVEWHVDAPAASLLAS